MISVDRAKARRQRAQAMAKGDILDAALRAFARRGYADTKMTDIAAEAGYTAASLYTYFPGKKEIFIAAADHFVEGVRAAFGPVPEAAPADFDALEVEVRNRIGALVAYGDDHREILAFFLRMRWSGEQVIAELRSSDCHAPDPDDAHGPHRIHAHMANVWRGLGVERFGMDPYAVASLAAAMIESFFMRRFILGAGGALREDAEPIANLLLYGLKGKR